MVSGADLEFKVEGHNRDAGGVTTETPEASGSRRRRRRGSVVWAVPLPQIFFFYFFSVKMTCFGASYEAF